MADENWTEYYQRREQAERALAVRSNNPEIAKIHLDLAERYARQAGETKLGVRPKLHLARS